VKADDPEKTLYDFIPPDYAKNLEAFTATVEQGAETFRPLGTRVGAYRMKNGEEGANGAGGSKGKGKGKSDGGPVLPERQWEVLKEGEGEDEEVTYEAYWSNWDTPGFKEYHRRMQIFVLLYIEGASYIDEEDGRWEFVTLCVFRLFLSLSLFRTHAFFAGSNDASGATRFRTTSPDTSRFTRSSAGRIRSDCDSRASSSPLLPSSISADLPPMQTIRPPPSLPRSRSRLCVSFRSSFKEAKFNFLLFLQPPSTLSATKTSSAAPKSANSVVRFSAPLPLSPELTLLCDIVEDPSETFDDMRDKCDLYTLIEGGDVKDLTAPLDRTKTEAIRTKYKLADVRLSLSSLPFFRLTGISCSANSTASSRCYFSSRPTRMTPLCNGQFG
jgi:hypothetical protein